MVGGISTLSQKQSRCARKALSYLSCTERLMWEWVAGFNEPPGMELQKCCFTQNCFTNSGVCVCVRTHIFIAHPSRGTHTLYRAGHRWCVSSWLVTLDRVMSEPLV